MVTDDDDVGDDDGDDEDEEDDDPTTEPARARERASACAMPAFSGSRAGSPEAAL